MPRCEAISTPGSPQESFKPQSGQTCQGRQLTTAKTFEAEQEIVRRMREGRSQIEPILERPQAITVADRHPHLNRAQQSVVEDVLSSRDRIQGLCASELMPY